MLLGDGALRCGSLDIRTEHNASHGASVEAWLFNLERVSDSIESNRLRRYFGRASDSVGRVKKHVSAIRLACANVDNLTCECAASVIFDDVEIRWSRLLFAMVFP